MNETPAGDWRSIDVPTPALVIDERVVLGNLDRAAAYAKQHEINLRPHAKTHKSLRFAQLQKQAGMEGLSVSKVEEGLALKSAETDLLLAYPLVDAARLMRVAETAQEVMWSFTVDSLLGVQRLEEALSKVKQAPRCQVLVDMDLGMRRTGVQSTAEVIQLAQAIEKCRFLNFQGLFVYPGQLLQAAEAQEPYLLEMNARLEETIVELAYKGIAVGKVSSGSTPTLYRSHLMRSVTEIRPGTYLFNDVNTLAGGFCERSETAAWMHCTVVSTAVKGRVILDAGSKALSSERSWIPGVEGFGMLDAYPEASIVKLSEEHAMVEFPEGAAMPVLGERVRVLPNHICPCLNQHDRVWLETVTGELEDVEIEARGTVI